MAPKRPTVLHSRQVLELAAAAYQRSLSWEPEAEVCVTLAAAAFEGFLNELAETFAYEGATGSGALMSELLAEAEAARSQAIFKFRLAAFALTGKLPSKGDQRIQDLTCLVRLRNSMLHLRPEPMFDLDAEPHIERPLQISHLIDRKVIQEPHGYVGSWRQLVSDSRVAKWAFETATEALSWIAGASEEENVRLVLQFSISRFPILSSIAG